MPRACEKSREQERAHADASSDRIRSRARLARRRATVPHPAARAGVRAGRPERATRDRVRACSRTGRLLSRRIARRMERYVVHIDADTFHAPRLGMSRVFPRPDSRDREPRAIVSGQRRQRDPGDDAERHGRRRRVAVAFSELRARRAHSSRAPPFDTPRARPLKSRRGAVGQAHPRSRQSMFQDYGATPWMRPTPRCVARAQVARCATTALAAPVTLTHRPAHSSPCTRPASIQPA